MSELLEMDSTCPWCQTKGGFSGDPVVYDGSERRCLNCGRPIVAVAYTDDTMSFVRIERLPWRRTARQRARDRKRRRGWA